MTCERLSTCPFYNDKMDIESGLGKMYKKRYCEGDQAQCARYKIAAAIGKEFVPIDIYPNMIDRADKIIEEHKTKSE